MISETFFSFQTGSTHRKMISRLVEGYFIILPTSYPTDLFTMLAPRNSSIDSSELYEARPSTNFEALKL